MLHRHIPGDHRQRVHLIPAFPDKRQNVRHRDPGGPHIILGGPVHHKGVQALEIVRLRIGPALQKGLIGDIQAVQQRQHLFGGAFGQDLPHDRLIQRLVIDGRAVAGDGVTDPRKPPHLLGNGRVGPSGGDGDLHPAGDGPFQRSPVPGGENAIPAQQGVVQIQRDQLYHSSSRSASFRSSARKSG